MDATSRSNARPRRMRLTSIAAVLVLWLTIGVPPTSAVADAQIDVDVHPEIAYTEPIPADTRGNLLDLYLPSAPDEQRLPLIIWSSGSAWAEDDGKSGTEDIAEIFNDQGYAVAGVSVRSSSQVRFPGQLHDIRAAIRWLRENADVYGLDPSRFAIMGTSSGGWLSAIAATTSDIEQLPGEPDAHGVSSSVQVAVPFFPPTDFLRMNEAHSSIDHDAPDSPESQLIGCPVQTCPDSTRAASPITYADAEDPSMLIIHGTDDPLVPHSQSVLLFDALANAGSAAGSHPGSRLTFLISAVGAGHSLSEPSDFGEAVLGADDFTVLRTNRRGRHEAVPTPTPTWKDIETFIDAALSRAEPLERPARAPHAWLITVVGNSPASPALKPR